MRILEVENHHRNESFNVGVQDDDIVGDVDFLYSDNMIFWTNLDQEAIYRLVLDDPGKTIEPVITTRLLSPDGLACDWVGRHLYWVDSETKRIEVSELNGINQKVLYWQGIDQPRGVVLDPYKG